MRILHYSLGFPPYRTGGLTKFSVDLMMQQIEGDNEVALMWPGKMGLVNKQVKIVEAGAMNGIRSFEIYNSLPISYDEGILDIEAFIAMGHDEEYQEAFSRLFIKFNPEILHIHTLMGLHKVAIETAKSMKVKLIYTTHDFYPLCPKVTMFRNGVVCLGVESCNECPQCNETALSGMKIHLLQSPIYRRLKNTFIVRKLRGQHRDAYLSSNEMRSLKKNQVGVQNLLGLPEPSRTQVFPTSKDTCFNKKHLRSSEDYLRLKRYYLSMLELMDVIHCNSSVTEMIYHKYLPTGNLQTLGLSHGDIYDRRKQKSFEGRLKLTYLGAQSACKGYFILKEALDFLWKDMQDFELNIYFRPVENAPYIKSHSRYTYPELEDIFDKTDMLVVPSIWNETFGYTVLEALSFGVPVLISSNVGSKDIIPKGAGIVIEDISAEKIAEEVKMLTKEALYRMNNHICKEMDILNIKSLSDTIMTEMYQKKTVSM